MLYTKRKMNSENNIKIFNCSISNSVRMPLTLKPILVTTLKFRIPHILMRGEFLETTFLEIILRLCITKSFKIGISQFDPIGSYYCHAWYIV